MARRVDTDCLRSFACMFLQQNIPLKIKWSIFENWGDNFILFCHKLKISLLMIVSVLGDLGQLELNGLLLSTYGCTNSIKNKNYLKHKTPVTLNKQELQELTLAQLIHRIPA